jgi:hypothetical protein
MRENVDCEKGGGGILAARGRTERKARDKMMCDVAHQWRAVHDARYETEGAIGASTECASLVVT